MTARDAENAPAGTETFGFLDLAHRGLESAMDSLSLGSTEGDLPTENRRPVEVREVHNAPTPVAATTHRAVDGNPVAPVVEGDPSKVRTTLIILVTGLLFAGGLIGLGLLIVKALS